MSDQNNGKASALDKYLQKQNEQEAQSSQVAPVTPIAPMPQSQFPSSSSGRLNLNIASTPNQVIEPGGFWRRAMANMIDGILMNFVVYPPTLVITLMGGFLQRSIGPAATIISLILSWVVMMGGMAAYFVWFYTKKGATPGKLVMGLRVLDSEKGTNMTWGQVLLREFIGKFCSAIILGIGYFLVGFREDKKALHDLMFNSRVVRVRPK